MKPNLGMTDTHRTGVVQILNRLLADEYLLYTKTRNFHWNVTGLQFNELHKFFEAQYILLEGFVDQVAERARALGGIPLGSLAEFLKHGRLKEQTGKPPAAAAMLALLLADHEAVVRTLRADLDTCAQAYSDAGTQDFLTGLMEEHEKMAWMLRAFTAPA